MILIDAIVKATHTVPTVVYHLLGLETHGRLETYTPHKRPWRGFLTHR